LILGMERQRTNFAPAMFAALLLHVGALVGGLIIWPLMNKPLPVGSVTAVTLVAGPPAPPRPAEQAPEPAPATAPEPTPVAPPPPPAPAPKPAPTPRPQPAPKLQPEPPKAKPQATKSAQTDSLDLAALTSSLDRQAARSDARRAPGARGPLRAERAPIPRLDPGVAEAATNDAAAAVGARLNRMWNKRCDVEGFRKLDDIQVQFHLTPEGDLEGSPEVISARRSDPVWQAAADAAVRAVYQAKPFRELPRQTYSQWRTFTANYQAKKACSQ
jgi:colicin import membrane protein